MKLEDHRNSKISSQNNWDKIRENDPSLTWLKIHCTDKRKIRSNTLANFNFLKLFVSSIPDSEQISIHDEEKIKSVGRDIGNNTALRTLQICGPGNDDDPRTIDSATFILRKLCEGGLHHSTSIQHLILSCIDGLGGEMISLLTPMISNCNSLRTIQNIGGKLTHEDVFLLAQAIVKRKIPLEGLILFGNGLSDLTFREFMSIFLESPGLTPQKMYFSQNSVGKGGYIVLARLLKDPKCLLEVLHIYDNTGYFDDEIAILFANALKKNKSLTTLKIDRRFITNVGWNAFSSALCDETDKNATAVLSNHTLKCLHCFPEQGNNGCSYPKDLQSYLEMNKLDDKLLVARRKVFERNFLGGDYELDEFSKMNLPMLVNVLAFFNSVIFAKEELNYGDDAVGYTCLTIAFRIVRKNPLLCNYY
ncbi:hypothetical protein ACHAXS_002945 [Conticribra weissflogii]